MPTALIGAVAGPVLGGLIGGAASSGDREAARQAYQNAQAAFAAIQNAPDESKPLLLQKYRAEGTLTPALEQAIQQGPSAAAGVTTDPALMKAQMQALQSLQQQATGGMTPQARAALNQARTEAETEATGRQQALMQNMQARGLGGSGAELAAALQGGQAGASRAAEESDRLMAQNAAAAQQAALSSGQLGGQIQGQQFNQAMQKAQAQDELNRFNIQTQQAAQRANVGALNQAQAGNLANLQNIGTANVNQANQELQRQSNARQQQWQNNLALAQAKAGQSTQYGNQMGQMANQTAQGWTNIGSGVGSAVASAYAPQSKGGGMTFNFGGGGSSGGTQIPQSDYFSGPNPYSKYDGGEIKDYRHGGPVEGHAKVPGDSPENDTVDAKLSPGEIVVPRTLAKTELGKSILKLIEHHNELKKHMADGGEVRQQDPSFMDKVANYFAPAPNPYDKLAQQGINPADLQRAARTTGMNSGGMVPGYADGGDVTPPANMGEEQVMKNQGLDPKDLEQVAAWRAQHNAQVAANMQRPDAPVQPRVPGVQPTPYQKFAQYATQPHMADGGAVQNESDYLNASLPPESDEDRASRMAAAFQLAKQQAAQQPQIPSPQIQDMGEVDAARSQQRKSLQTPVDRATSKDEEETAEEGEKISEAAKRHSGDRELADEAIGAAFEDPFVKEAIANRDLEHEYGAADEKAGSEAMPEDKKPDQEGGKSIKLEAGSDLDTSKIPGVSAGQPKSDEEESPVNRLLASMKPESSFAEQLRQAQEDERQAILANQLGRSASLIGAGIAKVDPSKEALATFDQNIKLASLPMEQLQQRVAMSKNDPDSDVSKASRDFLSKLTGKPVPESYSAADIEKISPMMEKYIQAQETAQAKKEIAQQRLEDAKEKEQERREQKDREFAERVRHSKSMEDISKGLSGIREDQLVARQVNQLKNQLERGRTDLNQARTAIQQANNIYASVGLPKGKYSDADIDKIPEEKLNSVNVAVVPEIAIEMNKMLTSGGIAAQNTLNKLVPNNLNMSAAQFLSFLSSNPEAANQSGYLRAYLKIASRVKEQREEYLKDYHKHIGAGLQTLKKRSPDDYEEIKTMYPEIDQSPVQPASQQSGGLVTIRRKSDGMTKTLPADAASKYLKDPGFEQVK